MDCDKALLDKLRVRLRLQPDCREQVLFGCQAFLLAGNLCCAVRGNALLVRVESGLYRSALAMPGFAPFVVCGVELHGWLLVPATELPRHQLLVWVERACEHVSRLPARE